MQTHLEELNRKIEAQLDRLSEKYLQSRFIHKFDGETITLHVIFDKVNQLGNWFVCTINEKRFPLSSEIIGITIDYFDSNNYLHYFIRNSDDEHDSNSAMKLLATIFEEFQTGDLCIRYSRFHIQHT